MYRADRAAGPPADLADLPARCARGPDLGGRQSDRQALVSDLVSTTRLRSAVAVNSSIFQSTRIVAPAVAGTLITTAGCGAALCVDTLFFALGAFTWSRLRVPASAKREPEREQAPAGRGSVFRYLHREPRIALIILLVGVVGTFGLNFPIVLTVIAQHDFSGSADLYGVFNLMLALGSIAGALIAAGRAQARLAQIIGLCAVFGAVQLAGAFTGDLLAFLACLVALGASNLAFQTVANSAVQLWTEPPWRGRVLGVYGQLFVGGTPLGAPLIGALTAREGGRVGMAVCGGVPLAAAVILGAVLASRRERGGEERVSRAALARVVRPASGSTQENRPTRPEKAATAAESRARCVRHGESAHRRPDLARP
jgi:Transmembrane secretion effector